ncbi:MAG: adenine phosphoribosyltransferase [Acidobacteria bacterium]|nr:adenine phosphoribosyltransferase [Acidobacteriota bacterium]MBU4307005.1 adenine phosphoribosyltransferase [Acidobacteriota bacterium]MBU4404254.1 adenine phosphoribosyltransferase [Acidobacteriota bacterium]MCG2812797.1 adenine phosphoribosyltransferase [Candidatus Aminicenantes bacterium]
MNLETIIRDVPDFPKQGIIFKDITTLLQDGAAFRLALNQMLKKYLDARIDKVLGIEARGFIFAGVLAYKLGCGFVPARKPGKLPFRTIREEYTLEYGSSALEIHEDSIKPGEKVLIVDDLLATGGTALAAALLAEKLGGEVAGIEFLIELGFLKGRDKIAKYPVSSLITY